MRQMAEEDAAEAERLELAHARHLTEAGLLGWHARARLEDFQVDLEHSDAQETVLVALYEFMDSFRPVGKGLVLIGPSGAGKSFLMAAVVRELVAKFSGGTAVMAHSTCRAVPGHHASQRDLGNGHLDLVRHRVRALSLAIDDIADQPLPGRQLNAMECIAACTFSADDRVDQDFDARCPPSRTRRRTVRLNIHLQPLRLSRTCTKEAR